MPPASSRPLTREDCAWPRRCPTSLVHSCAVWRALGSPVHVQHRPSPSASPTDAAKRRASSPRAGDRSPQDAEPRHPSGRDAICSFERCSPRTAPTMRWRTDATTRERVYASCPGTPAPQRCARSPHRRGIVARGRRQPWALETTVASNSSRAKSTARQLSRDAHQSAIRLLEGRGEQHR